MNVVIGFDGSTGAQAALDDLARAGLPPRASAMIVSAAEFPAFPTAGMTAAAEGEAFVSAEVIRSAELEVERARSAACDGAALVARLFPEWEVRSDTPNAPAYSAIVNWAYASEAELVVVGSHDRSAPGRMFFGSVSQSVLTHAPCSVRVGRLPDADLAAAKTTGVPLRLLLAVDGSSASAGALDAVRSRRWPRGTEVRLVTVVDLALLSALAEMRVPASAADELENVRSPVERVVRSAGERLRTSELNISTCILEGDPKTMLVREAERWHADCVFIGAQGHSRIARFLIGSVSAAVAARAGCTVEVVRQRRVD